MMFYELLQVALGNREMLCRVPSAEEWMEIYAESERQSVIGILIRGIDRLPAEQRPPQALLLQWIGVGQMIEQRNQLFNERCKELLSNLTSVGLHPTILKGLGIALYYPEALRILRQPGDIDVYVSDARVKAISLVKGAGLKVNGWDYKHAHLEIWKDTEIEMHYHVEVLLNLWKSGRLQKWFDKHKEQLFDRQNDFVTPTTEFNVFYILLHIYRHFLYEGVGLRQIVDYYMVLRTVHGSSTSEAAKPITRLMVHDYVEAVYEFGMEKFANGLMWVMQETLGMPREWMLWNPDEKEGRYILNQVMTGGNFGHHDERLKHTGGKLGAVKAILTHNLHLLAHYPSDVIWAPVWIVWHKCWKMTRV